MNLLHCASRLIKRSLWLTEGWRRNRACRGVAANHSVQRDGERRVSGLGREVLSLEPQRSVEAAAILWIEEANLTSGPAAPGKDFFPDKEYSSEDRVSAH